MEKFWEKVMAFLERNLVGLFCKMLSVTDKIITYLQDRRKDKIQQQTEKKIQKAEEKIDDACDNGGIDDLFDAAEELKKAGKKRK